MGIATAAIIGAAVVGAAASANEGNKSRRAAATAARDKQNIIAGVKLPDIEDQELDLLIPQLVGEYDPEVMQSLNLDPSDMENVSVDQDIKNQQLKALAGLSEVAEGGLTEADRAASRDIQREVAQNNVARQKALLSEMDQRGVLGSGMELAARMKANQMSADAQSRAGDQLAQQAQARALQAMIQQGNMASQVRGQEFGEQSQVAQARDVINRFNTNNRQDVANQNINMGNEAQRMNLMARQAQADNAAALKNQQQIHNKNLLQQDFNNRAGMAGKQIGIVDGRAAAEQAAHANTGAAYAQAANAIGSGIASQYGEKK